MSGEELRELIERKRELTENNEALALIEGGATFTHLECVLKSGRTFSYQFSTYPFSPYTTPEQAEALAKRIVAEKYRYCEWDRSHATYDSEQDITEVITAFILHWVRRMQKVLKKQKASNDQPRTFVFWGIFAGDHLVEEFPYREREVAEQRFGALLAEKGDGYQLRQIKRTLMPD
jgi:hypothetical protein